MLITIFYSVLFFREQQCGAGRDWLWAACVSGTQSLSKIWFPHLCDWPTCRSAVCATEPLPSTSSPLQVPQVSTFHHQTLRRRHSCWAVPGKGWFIPFCISRATNFRDTILSVAFPQDIVLSFTARQQGSFQVRQLLDILGHVMHQSSDSTDVSELEFRSFHTISLHLSAVCCSETKQPVPKLNPGKYLKSSTWSWYFFILKLRPLLVLTGFFTGISPAVTNPAGSWPYILSSELELCRGMVRAAVLCADKAQLHTHCKKMNQNTEEEEFLAFPNDRASSIRPASSPTQYR